MTDIVLQHPDLYVSLVAVLLQYVHELQQLSLQTLIMSDKSLLSIRTLVRSSGTEHNLQSLVWSGDLHLKSVWARPFFLRAEKLYNNCYL